MFKPWHDGGMPEPVFRYHPDPLATGSAVRAEHRCDVCGLRREVRYHGPVYGNQPESLCLYCIKSGEASRALGLVSRSGRDHSEIVGWAAMFSDETDVPDDVPSAVADEIAYRTPGFHGWQQQSWLYHCGDGAAYLGPAGYADLRPHPDALEMLRLDIQRPGWSHEQTELLLRRLDRTDGPTAYLFQCLHCGTSLASWDID